MAQRIGLGQLRNSAAYYFDRVAAGESFDVVRSGRMVAQIVPVGAALADRTGGDGVDRGVGGEEGVRSSGVTIASEAFEAGGPVLLRPANQSP